MNEAETRTQLILPALQAAGWGVGLPGQLREEYWINEGRIEVGGQRGKALKADYVLEHRGVKLGVVEAKARDAKVTEGLAQAKEYARRIDARAAFSTNGRNVYWVDMKTGKEGQIPRFKTPDELWKLAFGDRDEWWERFLRVPTENRGGSWASRYYQDNAINKVLEAVAANKQRILLTLATGTGKTSIAFQIIWKLFKSKWTLKRDGQRQPRILFLADRNTLAGQAFLEFSSFSAFPQDALVRISPKEIRKKGGVIKNGSIFFTIFQTFMTGGAADTETETEDGSSGEKFYFHDYPPDFFDMIVVDECHRGGARDESSWRGILEYFAPAVQLGLTATPKRKDNVDTYAYFGEPVYTYSLKEGINDGFLTPFRVVEVSTTIDDYIHTSDNTVVQGEVEVGQEFSKREFNRKIEIPERERYRVRKLMSLIDQSQKTLVFCKTQDHALMIRDMINQEKTNPDPDYCVRVTADDGAIGDQHLGNFQDNDKTIPTVLTTSQKLSTGVDARNVRNIVLMRSVNSMIEFKQIVGRGTRLFDGKHHFTIYDFEEAHQHFSDPEWDGEPQETEPAKPPKPPGGGGDDPGEGDGGGGDKPPRPEKILIKLADGKVRQIQSMVKTSFFGPDNKPMSAEQFIESLFGTLPELFKDESELRRIWSDPATREGLLTALEEKGFGRGVLRELQKIISAEKSDLFDVLAYVRFAMAPLERSDRANRARLRVGDRYSPEQQEFIDFVLGEYVAQGVDELSYEKLGELIKLRYGTLNDARSKLGETATIRQLFAGFQPHLYDREGDVA